MLTKFRPKLIVVLVILFMLIIIGTSFLPPDNKPINEHAIDAYEFPITPYKTPEEWKKLNGHAEMVAICQLPEDVLGSISTEGLFETCLNYPLYADLLAFNFYQHGFKSLCHFNGLQELLNRPEAGPIILNYYKNLDYNNLDKYTRFPTFYIPYIEMMLAQDSVLSGMELSERSELLKIALKRSTNKYSGVTTNVLVGRILKKDNHDFQDYLKENPRIEEFINKASVIGIPGEDWNDIVKKFMGLD